MGPRPRPPLQTLLVIPTHGFGVRHIGIRNTSVGRSSYQAFTHAVAVERVRLLSKQAAFWVYRKKQKALNNVVTRLLPKGVHPTKIVVAYVAARFSSLSKGLASSISVGFQKAIKARGWKVGVCRGPVRVIDREMNAACNMASIFFFFTLFYSGGDRRGSLFESKPRLNV
ncbi:hypothetical protein BDK51DRAFT_25532 [Blyttiomyces helicus]|uniref:Uncharacterized protein n=1 Tax=Blyttiomyces helicus TaxID=388810 RepID=A0A4P9W5R8_9FUNG|nr:hypothetical protein BDK51DRAFT_25532 [Blyttiomyces helicus]|eukprot:RKO86683.1 hypothetical protein BDK51DRAFT_25532 [Blyttiomyces helicus]